MHMNSTPHFIARAAEVRQRSLTCAGNIIALMGDEVADTVPELLAVLMQRLDNEVHIALACLLVLRTAEL
jgi:hypothetical protein